MSGGRRRIALLLAGLATLTAGCGSSDPSFNAEEFIELANEHDAGLVLGPGLDSGGAGQVYALSFEGAGTASGATGPGASADVHGGGSLTATADPDAGLEEYERCERAATLLCFRVSNVVMIFEGAVSPVDLARLEAAVRAIGEEE